MLIFRNWPELISSEVALVSVSKIAVATENSAKPVYTLHLNDLISHSILLDYLYVYTAARASVIDSILPC